MFRTLRIAICLVAAEHGVLNRVNVVEHASRFSGERASLACPSKDLSFSVMCFFNGHNSLERLSYHCNPYSFAADLPSR